MTTFYEALGVRIPMIRMPVAPGRNVAILVEVAARNQLLRARGHHAARRLVDRAQPALDRPAAAKPRSTETTCDAREAARGEARRADRRRPHGSSC